MANAKRPPGLIYSEDDIDAVVRTMLGEAANQGDDGLAAIAHVAANRFERGGYGGSLYDVVHADKQFSAWNDKSVGGNNLVNISADDPRYIKARAIAEEVLNGRRSDNTGGAVNYFAPAGMTGKNGTVKGEPKWASQMSYTTTIGGHKFYSDDSAAGAAEKMANGSGVRTLQQQLQQRGFSPGPIDGISGPQTKAAVKAFQQANGLAVDGIVGPKTLAALNAANNRPQTQQQPAPRPGIQPPAVQALRPPPLIPNSMMPPRASRWQETGGPVQTGAIQPLPFPGRLQAPPFTPAPASYSPPKSPTGSSFAGGWGSNGYATPGMNKAPPVPMPRPRPGVPMTPQAGPAPVSFDIGAMFGGLGNAVQGGINTLGNAGQALVNTGANAIEGTKAAIGNTAQNAQKALQNELLGTVGGRTLLMNTLMGSKGTIYNNPGKYGATAAERQEAAARRQALQEGRAYIPPTSGVRSQLSVPAVPKPIRRPETRAERFTNLDAWGNII